MLNPDRDRFIGTWNLVSCDGELQKGGVIHTYGANPVGTLVYDRAGCMSVHLMSPGRENFLAADKARSTPAEAKSATQSYEAYFGTYQVVQEKRIVIHHVLGSLLPNWTETDQSRFYEFSGNRLILRTEQVLYGGTTLVAVMTWERVEGSR